MTISEAIARCDLVKPNQFDGQTKVEWLTRLDGKVWWDVIRSHEGAPEGEMPRYTTADMEKTLLVPDPYAEEVYVRYLQSMIDLENAEISKYNQSAAMYNAAYQVFAAWYNRTHLPVSAGPLQI